MFASYFLIHFQSSVFLFFIFFFFQAEDGIRDWSVTGVQTCALPIFVRLIEDYVTSAKWAKRCGYDFVDIKHCHGYLGHEFLSARTRDGKYGGSFENRTRFLTETVAAVRAAVPGLPIAGRVNAFELVPFKPHPARSVPGNLRPAVPEVRDLPHPYASG